jgi:hypothetical protein
VAAGAPPGDYELRVGLFSQGSNQRLNIVAKDGGFGGTIARLSPIPIERASAPPAVSALGMGATINRDVIDGLRLLGYSQEASEARPGAPIYFTLFWQSIAPIAVEPITIQLTSCGCARQPKITTPLTTTAAVHGTYPFSQWTSNEIVADRYGVRVPYDLPAGEYTLEVSIGGGAPIELGSVNVPKADRVLSEPPIDHRMEIKLDDSIELVGYNIESSTGSITLTLIWRALKSIDMDYTVFTHVIDPSGQSIGGQDNQPMRGAYPTSWWMPGEYVIDQYELNVKPGYAIEVGMYDPETGARLGKAVRLK